MSERFGPAAILREESFETDFSALDEIGIPKGALTELVSSPGAGPGGGLLLYGLLHTCLHQGKRMILIDGKNAFAPKGLPQAELRRLLWMRCLDAGEAVKAADLAIRDGNVPLIVLLLTLNPAGELRRIPANTWHRLQMLAEKSAATVLVFTPQGQIGNARLRLSVGGSFPLEKLHQSRNELWPDLRIQVERRRMSPGRRDDDEELRRASCA
jgi:hypothetical protein